jgi:hypothetical protein
MISAQSGLCSATGLPRRVHDALALLDRAEQAGQMSLGFVCAHGGHDPLFLVGTLDRRMMAHFCATPTDGDGGFLRIRVPITVPGLQALE